MGADSARVRLAPLLHDYTGGERTVEAAGATLGELLADMDSRFPGIAFRIVDEQGSVRRHMKVFVGQEEAESNESPVPPGAEVFIVGALSGG